MEKEFMKNCKYNSMKNTYEKMKKKYEIKIKKYNKKPSGVRKIGHVNFVEKK